MIAIIVLSCSEDNALGPAATELRLAATVVDQPPTGDGTLPFGPERYEKPKGSPVSFETEIVLPAGLEPPLRLVLENGAPDGALRASSAWVNLDGTPVFIPDDFNQTVARIEREITVAAGGSTLSVQLADEPGSFVRIWIQDSGTGNVGVGGGEVVLEGGGVVVDVPPGAVSGDQEITVEPVEAEPGEEPTALVYDFGPDGTTFDEPIELQISYSALLPALPSGDPVDETLLRLFRKRADGTWELLPGSVDPVTGTVTGLTDHFSEFGVLTLAGFCSVDDPNANPPVFSDMQVAINEMVPGGMIEICDGTHSVEGAILDRPLTIQPIAGASPVIQTSTEAAAFFVDGYAAGTVLIDGLTFAFATPTPAPDGSTTYAIRAQNAYDQLVIRNSTFAIDGAARGSVNAQASTVAGAAVLLDQIDASGGAFGVAAVDAHVEVTNSSFDGMSLFGVSIVGATATTPVGTASGRVEGNSFDNCGTRCVRPSNGAVVDVISNTFGQCGSQRCVSVGQAAQVEVRQNTFAAPVLTGDSGPDQNSIVLFTQSSSGIIEDNVFNGCGFDYCVAIDGGATGTISNNDFTHIAGVPEGEFADVISSFGGQNVVVDGNTLNGCGQWACYNIGNGATVTIRNETVNVPAAHGTRFILDQASDPAWTGPEPVVVFEDNVVTVTGPVGDPADGATYPVGVGVSAFHGQLTMERNSFVLVGSGVGVGPSATLIGRDNVFEQVANAMIASPGAIIDFRFNDFAAVALDIGGAEAGQDLTCNWWGNAVGPQHVDGPVPATVFTPWATAPIANGAGGQCDGS